MKSLIISDVFGRTKALEDIASSLSGSTDIVDPYNAKDMDFVNEEQAYTCFMSEVGLEAYAEKLITVIEALSESESVNLVGFSVGASVVWKVSAQTLKLNVSSATCFYGSQIRHMTDVYPKFPIQLIFPKKEQHFSVSELIDELSGRENVTVHQASYLHGFMNKHSKNYDTTAYYQFFSMLNQESFSKGSV